MLTDAQCRAAKPAEKPYKLSDARGLYLYVTPTGYKSWRWKYRLDGKEKRLTFGSYPDVKLAEARELRDEANKAKRQGVDPSAARLQAAEARAKEAATTFESVARLWHSRRRKLLTAKHAENVLQFMQDVAFPKLGAKPLKSITSPMVLEVLTPIEKRSVERAHRMRGYISDVFVYAIAAGLTDNDPAASLRKALEPVRRSHYRALRTIEDARALLIAAEAAPGYPLTKLGARLLALTAVRSGPLRHAEPHEFALTGDSPHWRIPAAKMKLDLAQKQSDDFDFVVPLAPASVEIVQIAMELTKGGPYLFPNLRSTIKPMSENAISYMYARLPGFARRHVPHGWRSTFSTIMNERAELIGKPGDRAVIDLMLGHKPKGVEPIYNRAAYMPRRRQIAEDWAELLVGSLPPAASLLEGLRHSPGG